MPINKPWEILTNRILEALEQGVAPWRRPRNSAPSALAVPANALTHKAYRGINIVMLQLMQQFCAYPTSHWLTFKQARDLGGNVLAGQKATPIAFWKMLSRPGEPDLAGAELEQRTRPMLRLSPCTLLVDGRPPSTGREQAPWGQPFRLLNRIASLRKECHQEMHSFRRRWRSNRRPTPARTASPLA